MPVDIDIKRADAETRAEIKTLHPKAVIRATTRAINKTGRGLRTKISKEVRGDDGLALKAATVKDSLRFKKARRTARPKATLSANAQRIDLKHYGAGQRRRGVSVRIWKAKGREIMDHTFIAKKLGGHVFIRAGKSRLPIVKQTGPSVGKEVEKRDDELRKYVDKTMEKRVREEINYEVQKARRR